MRQDKPRSYYTERILDSVAQINRQRAEIEKVRSACARHISHTTAPDPQRVHGHLQGDQPADGPARPHL